MKSFAAILLLFLLFFVSAKGSGTVYLYPETISMSFLDLRDFEKKIKVMIDAPVECNGIKEIRIINDKDSIVLDAAEFEAFERPVFDSVNVSGSSSNVDLIYIRMTFLSNTIPMEQINGKKCLMTLVFEGDQYLYQTVFSVSDKRSGAPVYKLPGAKQYHSKFSYLGIESPYREFIQKMKEQSRTTGADPWSAQPDLNPHANH